MVSRFGKFNETPRQKSVTEPLVNGIMGGRHWRFAWVIFVFLVKFEDEINDISIISPYFFLIHCSLGRY
jgi:hypothetical protein